MDEPDQGSTIVAFYGFPDRLLQFRGQSTPVFGAEDIGPAHKCPAEVGKTLLRPYISGHWHHELCQTGIARLDLNVHRGDSARLGSSLRTPPRWTPEGSRCWPHGHPRADNAHLRDRVAREAILECMRSARLSVAPPDRAMRCQEVDQTDGEPPLLQPPRLLRLT